MPKAKTAGTCPTRTRQAIGKLREKAAAPKSMEEYRTSCGEALKVFRLEAVALGSRRLGKSVTMSSSLPTRKIPEKALQEDPKLLMWYYQAVTRTGGD